VIEAKYRQQADRLTEGEYPVSLSPVCRAIQTLMGEMRNALRILIGKPEGKRPLGRPRRRWEDNIRMDGRGLGLEVLDWNHLAQDKDRRQDLVNTVMNLWFT
jgi:hypothetical protein